MAFFQPHGRPPVDPGLAGMQAAWAREWLQLHEDIFDHAHFDAEAAKAIEAYIESQEHLELKTVGIDIGSSTSHLLFAKIILEREAQDLSSRYVVVRRDIVWRSPIMLTPFTKAGAIDADKLGRFIETCYHDAGTTPEAIDSGAVILTGEAIKKSNAEAIDELFAAHAGKFVCATAGHQLEAVLTAHGSGAVAYSKDPDTCVLHVDIGGGTTKLALIQGGVILDLCAFAVGGRLIALDADGNYTPASTTPRCCWLRNSGSRPRPNPLPTRKRARAWRAGSPTLRSITSPAHRWTRSRAHHRNAGCGTVEPRGDHRFRRRCGIRGRSGKIKSSAISRANSPSC